MSGSHGTVHHADSTVVCPSCGRRFLHPHHTIVGEDRGEVISVGFKSKQNGRWGALQVPAEDVYWADTHRERGTGCIGRAAEALGGEWPGEADTDRSPTAPMGLFAEQPGARATGLELATSGVTGPGVRSNGPHYPDIHLANTSPGSRGRRPTRYGSEISGFQVSLDRLTPRLLRLRTPGYD
jgi:hypothetical protein